MNSEKVETSQGDKKIWNEYPLVFCPRTHPPQALFCGEEVGNKNENISGMNWELREKGGWRGGGGVSVTAKIPYFHICFQLYLCQVILLFDETNPRN